MWQSALKALSIPDWLIIVAVHEENKVKSKILRTSVYDKVKSEFTTKSVNRQAVTICYVHWHLHEQWWLLVLRFRCVLFSEPLRNDPMSEAWSLVTSKIQELMLMSFSRLLSKFEDQMREQRERRNEPDWTFTKYFLIQVQSRAISS